jgi:multiple sugar transport system ATP-binding protein
VDSAPPNSSLEAQVDLIEPLGSETLVHAIVAGQPLTARVGADSELRRGQRVELVVDTRHLHVFERKSQRAITR